MSEIPEHLVNDAAQELREWRDHQELWAVLDDGRKVVKSDAEDIVRVVLATAWEKITSCLEGSHLFQGSSTCSRCGVDAYNLPGAESD